MGDKLKLKLDIFNLFNISSIQSGSVYFSTDAGGSEMMSNRWASQSATVGQPYNFGLGNSDISSPQACDLNVRQVIVHILNLMLLNKMFLLGWSSHFIHGTFVKCGNRLPGTITIVYKSVTF